MALSALVGADATFKVLLQAASPALLAGVDGPRAHASAPLAPLEGTPLSDAAIGALLEGGALPTGSGAPAPGAGAVVSVVSNSEAVALGADVCFHARAPAPATALSSGVALRRGGGWHLPIEFFSRPTAFNPPTGVAITVVGAQWAHTADAPAVDP